MPASFIALQCFQCSTMQVKQQKKSSNKWSCVVCNEKQSVRRLFAQSPMAKDVRVFVQNFNMSRQLSDQKQSLTEELETFNFPKDEQKRKRNDWTEYVDHEEYRGKFDKNGDLADGAGRVEPMVVTEMPKALFKKPIVKDYSSSRYGAQNLLNPQFPNRSSAKRHKNVHSHDAELTEVELTSCELASKNDNAIRDNKNCSPPSERALKWNRFRAQVQDDHSSLAKGEIPSLRTPIEGIKKDGTAKGVVSKWSSFITEEDDENLVAGRERTDYHLELSMNDEKVEDDIHPDFL